MDFSNFIKNSGAVAESVGTLLTICLVVIMLSSLAGIMVGGEPSWTPRIKLEDWVDASAGAIYIRHSGGEPLSVEDVNILVYINGARYEYSSADISANLGNKNSWELADVVAINPGREWGHNITEGDVIKLVLVNVKERVVVPQVRIEPENESSVLTPEF